MDTNRREFLKGTAWMGAAAIAAGCISAKNAPCCGEGGSMFGFVAKPLKRIRVGCVGLGARGSGAVHRLANIPGVEVVALCDVDQHRVDIQQKWLKAHGKPPAKEFVLMEAGTFEPPADFSGWTVSGTGYPAKFVVSGGRFLLRLNGGATIIFR